MSPTHTNPATNTAHKGDNIINEVPNDAHSVLIIRLKPEWKASREEIEDGYVRAGFGWREGISSLELRDSVRAWWRLSAATLKHREIRHVVAAVDGLTRAIYRIERVVGPRERDERYAFEVEEVESGELFDLWVGPNGKTVPFTPRSQNPVNYWPKAKR